MNYQGNNPEGYPDPTANQAVGIVSREEKEAAKAKNHKEHAQVVHASRNSQSNRGIDRLGVRRRCETDRVVRLYRAADRSKHIRCGNRGADDKRHHQRADLSH